MASAGTKESQTAVPTTSRHETEAELNENDEKSRLVQKVNTIEELDELLADSTQVFLIEFFAEWCGPCKIISQKLEKWASMYDVKILKIDIDELEDVAMEYNVTGIPSFAFVKDRTIIEQLNGSQEEAILAALDKHCQVITTESGTALKRTSFKSDSKNRRSRDFKNPTSENVDKD